MATVHQ